MYYGLRGNGWDDVNHDGHGDISGMTTEGEPEVAIDAGDGDRECPDCGAYIEEGAEEITAIADDPELSVTHVDGHDQDCGQKEWRADESIGMHFNGAGVLVRESENRQEVQVWISVGDPRGAFCMTLELMTNGDHKGELRLSVPTDSDSLPHMKLTPLASPGYFRIR